MVCLHGDSTRKILLAGEYHTERLNAKVTQLINAGNRLRTQETPKPRLYWSLRRSTFILYKMNMRTLELYCRIFT